MSCGNHYKDPHIKIATSMGDIEVELYPDKAPKTVAAFLSYVDKGYYSNSSFYRVVYNDGYDENSNTGLIQGGIFRTDPSKANTPGIEHEPTGKTGLTHTSGTISLARTTIGSASTEFFICIGDQTNFDEGKGTPADGKGYAAFGKVVAGMNIVRSIQARHTKGEDFDKDIVINKIERL
jgi:peptidyl-prolyl cis-trans isomerase A (cyclophilin A)